MERTMNDVLVCDRRCALWRWPARLSRRKAEFVPRGKREKVLFALSSSPPAGGGRGRGRPSVQWSDLSVTFVSALVMNQTGGRP